MKKENEWEKVAEINYGEMKFEIYDFWYYRVYLTIDNQEYYEGHFNTLQEALNYIGIKGRR